MKPTKAIFIDSGRAIRRAGRENTEAMHLTSPIRMRTARRGSRRPHLTKPSDTLTGTRILRARPRRFLWGFST